MTLPEFHAVMAGFRAKTNPSDAVSDDEFLKTLAEEIAAGN